MAGGKNKIHEHPKAATNTFRERPEDINKTGLNKKSYKHVLSLIKDFGYADPPPTKAEYMEVLAYLMVLTESDMNILLNDETLPYWIRETIKDLLDPNTKTKLMSEYRDWLFGKAEQKTENTINVNPELQALLEQYNNLNGK